MKLTQYHRSVRRNRVPLRRADRPFDIIRILRAASQPVTAAASRSMMLAFDESSSHVATKTTDLTTARF
jgi:hypothetical protein